MKTFDIYMKITQESKAHPTGSSYELNFTQLCLIFVNFHHFAAFILFSDFSFEIKGIYLSLLMSMDHLVFIFLKFQFVRNYARPLQRSCHLAFLHIRHFWQHILTGRFNHKDKSLRNNFMETSEAHSMILWKLSIISHFPDICSSFVPILKVRISQAVYCIIRK